VEPDDDDTEQNNTFDDKTSNVISIDDIPVADVKEIGIVTQVSIVDEVSTFCLFLDDLTLYVAVWFMSCSTYMQMHACFVTKCKKLKAIF